MRGSAPSACQSVHRFNETFAYFIFVLASVSGRRTRRLPEGVLRGPPGANQVPVDKGKEKTFGKKRWEKRSRRMM